jgi:poly(hydroxyalkanoate) depolymerase family esterase
MRPVIILSSLLLFPFIGLGNDAWLKEIEDFGPNPGNLKMYVHMPQGSVDTGQVSEMPLLVAHHGCMQTASSLADRTGWNELADEHGLIVLYPQQKWINNATKCFNWFRSKDQSDTRGETASILNMLDHAIEQYPVDTSRIYAYGLSAGASMAVSVMANAPRTFSAGAVFAGGPYKAATNLFEALPVMKDPPDKSPEEWGELLPSLELHEGTYPRLLVFHGSSDEKVDVENGEFLVEQWAIAQRVSPEADTVVRPYKGHSFIERRIHKDKKGREAVVFYLLHGKGHALPVDPGIGEEQGGTTSKYVKDMDFYSSYEVAARFGLLN